MSTQEYPHENWFEALKSTGQQFEAENDDLEAVLEGDIGFHAFFIAEGDDATRGAMTAVYQALYDTLEEMHVDADIVEHRCGEVTPEAVADEIINQIEHENGVYLSDHFRENIRERVEKRVRKNIEAREASSTGGEEDG